MKRAASNETYALPSSCGRTAHAQEQVCLTFAWFEFWAHSTWRPTLQEMTSSSPPSDRTRIWLTSIFIACMSQSSILVFHSTFYTLGSITVKKQWLISSSLPLPAGIPAVIFRFFKFIWCVLFRGFLLFQQTHLPSGFYSWSPLCARASFTSIFFITRNFF